MDCVNFLFRNIRSAYRTRIGKAGRGSGAVHFMALALVAICLLSAGLTGSADEWEQFKRATRNLEGESTGSTDRDESPVRRNEESLWLPPAVHVNPRRRKPKADWDLLHRRLYCYSYPAAPRLQSVLNPWGEQAPVFHGPIEALPRRILAACEVYRYQRVHFDGYLESTDDGRHLYLAADGQNIAVFGDNVNKRYYRVTQSLPDTLDERCWICVDLPIFALNLAGFPIRQAMVAHFLEDPDLYTENWTFPDNVPTDQFFFRRVENLRKYLTAKQFFSDDKITLSQYFNPNYRPAQPFQPGDVILMGHYKAYDAKKPFEAAKHSGIVATVNTRGLPVKIYNMRTSNRLIDRYDGLVTQWRTIKGEQVYFRRFCDRYSIIGHGRIVHKFERPRREMPTIQMVRDFLEKREREKAAALAQAKLDDAATSTSIDPRSISPHRPLTRADTGTSPTVPHF